MTVTTKVAVVAMITATSHQMIVIGTTRSLGIFISLGPLMVFSGSRACGRRGGNA